MPDEESPALTREQWDARDYRQAARELDQWRKDKPERQSADPTEYVAKLGLSQDGCVIVMNRAHDRVLVPPPARPALAAFALAEQPFGFTQEDVAAVHRATEMAQEVGTARTLRDLEARLQALVPPPPDERSG